MVFLWLSGQSIALAALKVVGSIPRESYWQKKCIAWMHCKSLWIKASDKCKFQISLLYIIEQNLVI